MTGSKQQEEQLSVKKDPEGKKNDLCYSKTIFISSLFVYHCGSGRLSVRSIYPFRAPDRRLYLLWMLSSDMKRIYRCCYDKFYYQDQRHNGGIEKIRPCVVLWEVETWIMQQRRSMKNLERERERESCHTHMHEWANKFTHRHTHTIPFRTQLGSVCLFDPWYCMDAKPTQTKALL